jgi:hypothetical protein
MTNTNCIPWRWQCWLIIPWSLSILASVIRSGHREQMPRLVPLREGMRSIPVYSALEATLNGCGCAVRWQVHPKMHADSFFLRQLG